MVFKAVLLCVSTLMVQSISGQAICLPSSCGCSGSGYGSSYGSSCGSSYGSGIGSGYGSYSGSSLSSNSAALSSGGDFLVTSLGPIVPTGISVSSDIGLSGDLDVCGALPFLSAVEFACELPTSGSGAVDYSCGCGSNVAITNVVGGSSRGCGCPC